MLYQCIECTFFVRWLTQRTGRHCVEKYYIHLWGKLRKQIGIFNPTFYPPEMPSPFSSEHDRWIPQSDEMYLGLTYYTEPGTSRQRQVLRHI